MKGRNNSNILSTRQINDALQADLILDDEFPDMAIASSFEGKKTTNMLPVDDNIPAGYKRMMIWDNNLQSLCMGIVPQDTSELTHEEFEKYSRINPK